MDLSNAIVNAIMADSGPAFASSSVANVMSDQHKKEERKAVRLDTALQPRGGVKSEGPLTRRDATKPIEI